MGKVSEAMSYDMREKNGDKSLIQCNKKARLYNCQKSRCSADANLFIALCTQAW